MKLRPFLLERFFAKHEFNSKYLLSSSDCEPLSLKELIELEPGSREKLEHLWLGYTDSYGSLSLRQAIAGLYTQVKADQILVHVGAQEAIFNFMNACLSPGDHIIVHQPCYQSLYEIPRALGCEVSAWPTHLRQGWRLDLNLLKSLIRPTTRAVVINSPHSPTGYVMDSQTQAELIETLRSRGILLFSDEVYRFLEFDPAARTPSACDLYEHAVSLNVTSKSFGLAGLRVGWIATRDRTILEKMAAFKDYTTICGSPVTEFLATVAIQHAGTILSRNRAIVAENFDVFKDFLRKKEERIECVLPRGGSLAFPRYRDGRDAEPICERVIGERGVMLMPGKYFETDPAHFRLGLGRRDFPEGLALCEDLL